MPKVDQMWARTFVLSQNRVLGKMQVLFVYKSMPATHGLYHNRKPNSMLQLQDKQNLRYASGSLSTRSINACKQVKGDTSRCQHNTLKANKASNKSTKLRQQPQRVSYCIVSNILSFRCNLRVLNTSGFHNTWKNMMHTPRCQNQACHADLVPKPIKSS